MLPILVLTLCSLLLLSNAKSHTQHTKSSINRPSVNTVAVQSLDGDNWFLINSNLTISVPATVPGSNYLDLLNTPRPVIGDPYYRFNSRDVQWIAYDPYWTWTTVFALDDELSASSHIEIHFDGIDTVANVTLNGQLLGRSFNQFRKVVYDVSGIIKKKGDNQLWVDIESPILYAAQQQAAYPIDLPVSDPASELPHRHFIRKVQSDFGWDWGVGTAASGIWKSVRLVAFSECIVEQISWKATPGYEILAQSANQPTKQSSKQSIERSINQAIDANNWYANVTVYLRTTQYAPVDGVLSITLVGGTVNLLIDQPINLPALPRPFNGDRLIPQSVIISVTQPDLWWPRDYGQQSLYNLTVSYKSKSAEHSIDHVTGASSQSVSDTPLTSMSKLVAFRTITIDRSKTPASADGLSMTFTVNNQSIYIKGANMVPLDALHTRVSADNITRLMDAAYNANMNLVRVWGGGLIQDPALYDYADKFGILVWQEMLFACAQYPVDEAFLINVREEVSQIVRFLSSHASLAVIGGNNENEAQLTWQSETQGTGRDHYLVAYNDLYVNTIRSAIVRELGATTVEYVASSPSNGPASLNPYTLQWGDPQSVSVGDIHWYDYSADLAEVKSFPRPRFLSEFGAQSQSSLMSYLPVTAPEDWSWNSDLMLFRQHHPDGNDQMMAQIKMHFNPANSTNTTLQFSDAIYLSQVSQSLSYTTGFHHWRRIQSEQGYCKGIVYWQLNDQWQAPTWASIEHSGRWKLTHNAVSNAYEQLLISGYLTPYKLANKQSIKPLTDQSLESLVSQYDDATFGVYAVSDSLASQGGYVNISLRHWATGEIIYTVMQSIDITQTSAKKVYGASINQFLLDSKSTACVPRTNCWIHLSWFQSSNNQAIHPSLKQALDQSITSDLLVSEFPVWLDALIDAPLNNSQLMIDVEMEFIDASIDRTRESYDATDRQLLRHAARYSNTPAIKQALVHSLHQSVTSPQLVIRLHVQCHAPAAYVIFESPVDGRWDDNGFLCTPQTTGRYLTFYPVARTIDHNYFRTTLNYYSIWDTYNRG